MNWKIYETWIDLPLYRQMADLVYRLSSRKDKYTVKKKAGENDPFLQEPEVSMEDAFGLHYPGEVLERLEERMELTERQYRALGLALAKTLPLQEPQMFNGAQKSGFLKRMGKELGENNLFYAGIRYLLEEREKQRWYEFLKAYPYQGVEELLFSLSILPEDEAFWNDKKEKIAGFLAGNRTISVYEDWEVYVWLVQTFYDRLKEYRKKDLDVLKNLAKLVSANAQNANCALEKRLAGFGYEPAEVRFLNFVLLCRTRTRDQVSLSSVTAEKVAVSVLQEFLSGGREYPKPAYELCSYILRQYQNLDIRIGGNEKILQCVWDGLKVQTVPAYLTLFPFRSIGKEEWFYIDLTEERWDPLAQELEPEHYEAMAARTLAAKEYTEKQLRLCLDRYRKLTGREFTDLFWERSDYMLRETFRVLEEKGILSAVDLMREYIRDYQEGAEAAKEKWNHMAEHLNALMRKLETEKAYRLLRELVMAFGPVKDAGLFDTPRILQAAFHLEGYEISRGSGEIFRPFLTREEHREVFSWVDEILFLKNPKDYPVFLEQLLLKESTLLWMGQEEAARICALVLPFTENDSLEETLRRRFMSKEDLEAYEQKRREMAVRRNWLEDRKKVQEIKKQFNRVVTRTKGREDHFKAVGDFCRGGIYSYLYSGWYYRIAASYLISLYAGTDTYMLSREEAEELLELLKKLYREKCLDFQKIRQIVDKTEV